MTSLQDNFFQGYSGQNLRDNFFVYRINKLVIIVLWSLSSQDK